MMKRHWLLRDALYRLFHRWPAMLVFIALGCLLGWLLAFVWPAHYKASRQVYVGLNAYRVYSDTNFLALAKPRYSNIDNYHYWQMNQLDTVLVMDLLLQQTLEQLSALDPYWENLTLQDFRDQLDTNWRTAGEWSLSVTSSDPARAQQALEVWSTVAVQRVQTAVASARDTFMIDQELEQAANALFSAQQRALALSASRTKLQDWLEQSAGLPQDQPLSPLERWRIFSAAASLALDDPAWEAILAGQPPADARPQAYQIWVEQVLQQIEQELADLPERITALEEQRQALKEKYSAASADSLSLSPNLEIQPLGPVSTQVVRPATTLILVGGGIGLLLWLLVELIGLTRSVQARE